MSASSDAANVASTPRTPACLIIMDGFGLAAPGPGNAISLASTPRLDELFATCSHTQLQASGESVGLPAGQMGNSEVGHLNIGAGRVVYQELSRINKACADGSLARNEVLRRAFRDASRDGAALHLMGLLSDGGVHSMNAHLYALLEAAKRAGVPRVRVHCFLDGRDVPPASGADYLDQLQAVLDDLAGGGFDAKIATVSGRYYAMDRDRRWDRVRKAWDVLVDAEPPAEPGVSASEAVRASYEAGVTDEFVVPFALDGRGIQDGDAVVFFNFRPDRAREITRSLVDGTFDGFPRPSRPEVSFVCLTEYDPTIAAPVVFPKEFPDNVLADVLADAGLRQFHIAETEKYAHVTFFLNGGVEAPKAGEERCLIASPKVATYDLQPQMSEPDVVDALVTAIDGGQADVYIVNFANPDMVGHTGVIPAAVAAVEAVDEGVGKVVDAMARAGGITLITADHGNADKMIAEDGTPHTAHTTAPVPLVLADASGSGLALSGEEGALCDIAPTLLSAMGVEVPEQMTGRSLLA